VKVAFLFPLLLSTSTARVCMYVCMYVHTCLPLFYYYFGGYWGIGGGGSRVIIGVLVIFLPQPGNWFPLPLLSSHQVSLEKWNVPCPSPQRQSRVKSLTTQSSFLSIPPKKLLPPMSTSLHVYKLQENGYENGTRCGIHGSQTEEAIMDTTDTNVT
jgi:hypothetical protein